MIDPVLSLAVSMQSSPGVYAVMLGSGVSRPAGIPTGWEVVEDLVRRLAKAGNEECGTGWEAWYQKKTGHEPRYTEILNTVAKSPAERANVLKGFFEPTEEERRQGLKVPTKAHRAIAKLVQSGYIRVIITTNFDRLMEQALEAVGIVPTVVSTADAVKGMTPLIHSKCTVIKVHGDYLDIRIKNTADEVENYEDPINELLDRVFDEFGLIICGWSGDMDVALRAAMDRCPTRRYATYWASRGALTAIGQKLLPHRCGTLLTIKDADSFFDGLVENVDALSRLGDSGPLSEKVAVARLKRYIAEDRYQIQLHDMALQEVSRVCREIDGIGRRVQPSNYNQEVPGAISGYMDSISVVCAILSHGSYWGLRTHTKIWSSSVERIASVAAQSRGGGSLVHAGLRHFPPAALLYAGGISAVATGKYETALAIMTTPQISNDYNERRAAITGIEWHNVSNSVKLLPEYSSRQTPLSDFLFTSLRPYLQDYITDDERYEEVFDGFEYLLAVQSVHMAPTDWPHIGRFGWNARWRSQSSRYVADVMRSELDAEAEAWAPLKAGFCGGKPDSFRKAAEQLKAHVENTRWY